MDRRCLTFRFERVWVVRERAAPVSNASNDMRFLSWDAVVMQPRTETLVILISITCLYLKNLRMKLVIIRTASLKRCQRGWDGGSWQGWCAHCTYRCDVE